MRHPKPLARSAVGSAAEGTLLGSAPCKPGQPRDPNRRNLRGKTSQPLNHQLRGPTDDCPPLPPARPKQCQPTLHGHSLNAASHDLRTSDTSDKIEGAPLCRSSFKKAKYRALDLQSRDQPRRCLEISTPDPVLAEASAAGVLPQRELEKFLSSGILWSLVGLAMNSTDRQEQPKTVCDSCQITSFFVPLNTSEHPWHNGWIPTSSPAVLWP